MFIKTKICFFEENSIISLLLINEEMYNFVISFSYFCCFKLIWYNAARIKVQIHKLEIQHVNVDIIKQRFQMKIQFDLLGNTKLASNYKLF